MSYRCRLAKRALSATRPSLRRIAGLSESNTIAPLPEGVAAHLRISVSLRSDVLFHNCGRLQFHRNALHQIASKRGGIAPVNLPSMVDCNQNVLSWNDVCHFEAAISVRLVLA